MQEKFIHNGVDCFVVASGLKVVYMFIGATKKEVETCVILLEAAKISISIYKSSMYNVHNEI